MNRLAFIFFPLALTCCANAQTSTVSQISAAIPVACNAVQNGLAAVATVDKGATPKVAQAQAVVAASCTATGQIALALNDAAPKTATNSGNSAAWLTSVLADAASAARIAVAVAPLL